MEKIRMDHTSPALLEEVTSDSKNCCGLCCVAVCFSKTDGFPSYKAAVDHVLKKTGDRVRAAMKIAADKRQKKDYFGGKINGANLRGKDFSMALLVAANLEGCNLFGANFLGADMRDANIRNTDLSQSIFLTQMQVNSARGNRNTILPPALSYPAARAGE